MLDTVKCVGEIKAQHINGSSVRQLPPYQSRNTINLVDARLGGLKTVLASWYHRFLPSMISDKREKHALVELTETWEKTQKTVAGHLLRGFPRLTDPDHL